ncbi:hypothetical protein [Haloquadratum walsbyi]|jgi:hypothetical protein|uniref:hypothetical protein n=1 Tax=Haloquadratum walsbyi TaxID=293091 RepID=UPI00064EB94B|nr:hypothetical protein [Haloquadratum walsbyi]
MKRDLEFEERLDKKALERFGPQTVQALRRNRENAHGGTYTEVIAEQCQGDDIEPGDLSREEKPELVLENISEQAHNLGIPRAAEKSMQRYEHAEKAYELLNEAYQELSQAGRFKLADRTEVLIKNLLMKSADQHPEVDQRASPPQNNKPGTSSHLSGRETGSISMGTTTCAPRSPVPGMYSGCSGR